MQAVLAPAYVLPDQPTRQEYLSRAVQVGRTQLIADFLFVVLFFPLQAFLLAFPTLGFPARIWWSLPAFLGVFAVGMWRQLAANREDERLRAWLQYVGKGAPPDAEPMETKRWARGVWGRVRALKRCRPGWMVAAEAAAFSAVAASAAVSAFGVTFECRKAMAFWWEAGASIASFPDGCFGAMGSFMLLTGGLFLAFAVATTSDWWYWNKQRA